MESFKLGIDPMPDWFCDGVSSNQVTTHGIGVGFGATLSHITVAGMESCSTFYKGALITEDMINPTKASPQ